MASLLGTWVIYMYTQSSHSHKVFAYTVYFISSLNQNHPPSPPSKKQKVEEDDDDPGAIFIFNKEDEIHNILGLPSVVNISPPLLQGRKTFHYYKLY